MKKHILLVLAAILVMGIQSCSKDEVVTEENQGLPENVISADELLGKGLSGGGLGSTPWYAKAYVVYPETMNYQDRINVLEYFRANVFSEIFALTTDNGCQNIDTWFVPCDETGFGCTKPDAAEINVEDKHEEEADPSAPPYVYSIKAIPLSTDCSEL